MWPWEHLTVGYLAYSVYSRLTLEGRLTDRAALAVAFGTQFPDLLDKPLAWVLTVMSDGSTIGHSVFVAVPLSIIAYSLSARRGHRDLGAAFAVGYLLHLPGDILYSVARGGAPAYTKVLWPFFTKQSSGGSLIVQVGGLSRRFVRFLLSPEGAGYAALELLLLAVATIVWIDDGTPGLGWLAAVRRDVRDRE